MGRVPGTTRQWKRGSSKYLVVRAYDAQTRCTRAKPPRKLQVRWIECPMWCSLGRPREGAWARYKLFNLCETKRRNPLPGWGQHRGQKKTRRVPGLEPDLTSVVLPEYGGRLRGGGRESQTGGSGSVVFRPLPGCQWKLLQSWRHF